MRIQRAIEPKMAGESWTEVAHSAGAFRQHQPGTHVLDVDYR
jgi:hypothetical protein